MIRSYIADRIYFVFHFSEELRFKWVRQKTRSSLAVALIFKVMNIKCRQLK